MNLVRKFPSPFNTFIVDIPAGQFYDFHLPTDSTYPLRGVIYPVDYGHILDHTAEDGMEIDLFIGNILNGKMGSIIVDRGEIAPQERKFYIALADAELAAILKELQPVLLEHCPYKNFDELLTELKPYKDKL